MANLKVEFLRHEYTWSSQCITGPKVGWGVTGSSTPLDKDKLIEIEKLAAGAVSDSADRVPIESLVYSQECGFTKMVTLPYHEGEDGRKSKMVHIYQVSEQVNMVPEAYLLPGNQWDDEKIGDYFAPMLADTMEEKIDDILKEMDCYDYLAGFLKIVYRALFNETESVNFVVDWSEHEFAVKSRKLMYVIHSLIPDPLCKKASYQSFSRGEVSNVTFYFSNEPISEYYVRIGEGLQEVMFTGSELDNYFYQRLADSYVKKDILYAQMIEKMSVYYQNHSSQSNTLRKLQWILVSICMRAGEKNVSDEFIMKEIPQLFYWCEDDEELKDAVYVVLDHLHNTALDARQHMLYQNALIDGYTRRSEQWIGEESIWSMKHLFHQRADLFKKQLKQYQQKNVNLYTLLLCADIEQENSFASQLFEINTVDFLMFRTYLLSMNLEVTSESFKDRCLVRGIDLLNEDLFRQKNYQYFDEIVRKFGREEQAASILKSFVLQLQELRTDLDDQRLETGSFVEKLLNEYEGTDKYILLTNEIAARQVKPSSGLKSIDVNRVSSSSGDSEITDEVFFSEEEIFAAKKKRKRKKKKSSALKEAMEEKPLSGKAEEFFRETETDNVPGKNLKLPEEEPGFAGIMMYTFPMGFISGCMFFILRFSMKIGHGKIALGMVGMWLLVMLSFLTYHQLKQWSTRTWQITGLCISQGLVIAVLGNILAVVHIHFIFFVALGLLAIALSVIRFRKERGMRLRKG